MACGATMNARRIPYDVISPQIHVVEGQCDNKPFIIGTDVKVIDIYARYELFGEHPEAIVQQTNLSLVQVFSALAFAYLHERQMQQDLNARHG